MEPTDRKCSSPARARRSRPLALLGAHASIAGGLATALREAQELGAQSAQIFVKSNRQWAMPALDPDEAAAFRAGLAPSGVKRLVVHGTYLVNLAALDETVGARSRATFLAEVRRCAEVGAESLIFHPGAHMGQGEAKGHALVAAALRETLEATEDASTSILLENAAGQGTTLGLRFAELARMIDGAGGHPRLGVCLDTCHAFAAGYDLTDDEGYDALMDEIEGTVDISRLRAVHLNDSMLGCGSRRDRHANIGEGVLGDNVFRRLLNDERLADVPMVLETPDGFEGYPRDLKRLRGLIGRAAKAPGKRAASAAAKKKPKTRR
jgi:deoxyribonuclease-4